jgi:hypothetical protein
MEYIDLLKAFIDSIESGDNIQATNEFEDLMSHKVEELLSQKEEEVANRLFNGAE